MPFLSPKSFCVIKSVPHNLGDVRTKKIIEYGPHINFSHVCLNDPLPPTKMFKADSEDDFPKDPNPYLRDKPCLQASSSNDLRALSRRPLDDPFPSPHDSGERST